MSVGGPQGVLQRKHMARTRAGVHIRATVSRLENFKLCEFDRDQDRTRGPWQHVNDTVLNW